MCLLVALRLFSVCNATDEFVRMLLFQTLDGDVYERMQEYFTLFCQSELQSCGITQECFMKILSDATKVSHQLLANNRNSSIISLVIKTTV